MIGNFLVDGSNQVGGTGIVQFEGESPARIRLSPAAFFHALAQFQQDHLIAGCRLPGGSIGDGAGESISRESIYRQQCNAQGEYARRFRDAGPHEAAEKKRGLCFCTICFPAQFEVQSEVPF